MAKTLVIGSTGNIGRALIEELVGANESVLAATRDPDAFGERPEVEPVRFDYGDQGSFAPALEAADRVFMIGPPVAEPHPFLLPFVEVAATPTRKIVLMTAMGVEQDEGASLRRVEIALEGSGAPFVFLRPNWFMDNFHTTWLAPIEEAGVIPLPAGDSETSFVDARDVAACAAAALYSDRFDGRGFTLTGPEALTYYQAAGVLSDVSDREIRYMPVNDESFIRSAAESGIPDDLALHLDALFLLAREGSAAGISNAVEEMTGRPPRPFQTYARDHASAWRN